MKASFLSFHRDKIVATKDNIQKSFRHLKMDNQSVMALKNE